MMLEAGCGKARLREASGGLVCACDSLTRFPLRQMPLVRSVWGADVMYERLNWMFPSVPLMRMFSTDIRLSFWFGLVPLVVCPKYGLELGLVYTALLYVGVLCHEFTHVFAARATGGLVEEIHLTPLGGLPSFRSGRGTWLSVITAVAGPAFNLLVCLMTFPGWYAPKTLWQSINPFVLPIDHLNYSELGRDLCLLLFIVNWMIFLVNLLPVMPLDGGQILRSLLAARVHPELVHRTALQIGLVFAVVLLLAGVSLDLSLVVLLGTFVLMINVVQLMHEDVGEVTDDSVYGYDFPTGFDSLESSVPTTSRQTRRGLFQQWRERRRVRREQQERIRRLEAEQQLDSLLAKVHESGLHSLSDEEQYLLRSCSELLRDRQKGDD